jgi:2,4-dichlorophenol 6-monooxygenase
VTVDDGGEYADPDGCWTGLREVRADGAVLVRPDNHVAWRAVAPPTDPGELTEVVRRVLTGAAK